MSFDTVITCHANADNDALAAMIGALCLYPNARLLFPGSQEKQVQDFYEEAIEILYPCITQRDWEGEQIKRLVVVDAHQKKRVPQVKKLLEQKGLDIHIWDHHPLNEDEDDAERLPASFCCIEKVGSASTLIAEEIRRRAVGISCESATVLASGIYGDTGSFLYSSATPRDFAAASWLLTMGADLAVVSRLIKRVMGREQLKALSLMLENTQVREIGGEVFAIASMQSETFLDDFATLAPRIMEIEDCKVLFAIASMEDKVQVVGRSSSPLVDVGEICRRLGGGGHHYAASASVKDMTLPQVRDFLLMQASLIVNADENAGSLMTSPAVGAPEHLSISEALSLMNRYGLKAVPVFAESRRNVCMGILTQETASKACGHGLGHIGVTMYMQQNFQCVPASAGIQELVDIMVGGQQRLIPVVEGEDIAGLADENRYAQLAGRSVVGVVTRTDIIRLFMGEHGAHIPSVSRSKNRKERNLSSVMNKRLSVPCLEFLRLAGELAEDMGISVYVVGGFVRDLVMDSRGMKWPDIDIDLVVEGDAIEFAHKMGIRLKGRVREHREFMTAMVVFPAGMVGAASPTRHIHFADTEEIKVDVATARLEFYAQPGALPQVERGSIKMDLYRRDFSINAMAVRLNPGVFGQLVDFFDGQDDIKNKRIRTLHALSFVEDPTRMFRAVRFEQRYGFRMGAQCERFMRNAIDDLHLVHQLSGSRICHEFELMLDEHDPYPGFVRMDELGLLTEVHPLLVMDEEKRHLADGLRRVLEWYTRMYLPQEPDRLMLMLMVLCRRMPAPDVEAVLDRLQFSPKRKRDTLMVRSSIMEVRQGMARWEKQNGGLSALHRMLHHAPLETLLYLLAKEEKPEQHEKLTRYIYQGRETKPDITGDDLKALGAEPGPVIGQILEEVLACKLDDMSMDRTAQLHLAAELLHKKCREEHAQA